MTAVCSDDIMAHIQRQQNCVRLSLYTASQLMYGTVVVFHKQQHYLIGLSRTNCHNFLGFHFLYMTCRLYQIHKYHVQFNVLYYCSQVFYCFDIGISY